MTYQELTNIIESIGSTKKELEHLLNYSTNYLSSFSKKPIPKHIVTTIKLLKIMHDNKIDWKNELKNMDIAKNIHKGGKFENKSQ
jgi:hypothetical protein